MEMSEIVVEHVETSKYIAFDIDGVLVRGSHVLPNAIAALNFVRSKHIPHVFVTNGGGATEKTKSEILSSKFGVSVKEDQILMSHTPYQDLVSIYGDRHVLVLGHDECIDVARAYGFKNPIRSEDLRTIWPTMFRRRRMPTTSLTVPSELGLEDLDIAAVLVFDDPLDWALEMQVVLDVLIGRAALPSSPRNDGASSAEAVAADSTTTEPIKLTQVVPIYSSNADIVYNTEHPFPRLTQGAFMQAFSALFRHYTGQQLDINYCGKPFPIQFQYAEKLLKNQAAEVPDRPELNVRYYMIGDNPKSDVRGARDAGPGWSSVLVRTGVFEGGDNDPEDPADVVVNDVLEAVHWIDQHQV